MCNVPNESCWAISSCKTLLHVLYIHLPKKNKVTYRYHFIFSNTWFDISLFIPPGTNPSRLSFSHELIFDFKVSEAFVIPLLLIVRFFPFEANNFSFTILKRFLFNFLGFVPASGSRQAVGSPGTILVFPAKPWSVSAIGPRLSRFHSSSIIVVPEVDRRSS